MSYITKIRKQLGKTKFIHPAARILVENESGEILFIERVDNGQLGLPAGGLEEGETIIQCIKREVFEETGLTIENVAVIGISSNPKMESVEYPNGDKIQYFTIEFYTKEWKGEIQIQDIREVKKAQFLPKEYLEKLPRNERSIIESYNHYQYTNQVLVK